MCITNGINTCQKPSPEIAKDFLMKSMEDKALNVISKEIWLNKTHSNSSTYMG